MCGKGPFKESQKNYEYLSLHGKVAHNYCVPCAKNAGLSTTELIDKSYQVAKEKVEEIKFEREDITDTPINDMGPLIDDITEPIPPVPIKEEEDPGPYYVYMGQFTDDTYISGVTKDLKKDIDKINSGQSDRLKKLPMELIYYHIEETKKEALNAKVAIMLMAPGQKEALIKEFTEKFFEK
jgi:predicted GIY-YIG superfamily endonuclease